MPSFVAQDDGFFAGGRNIRETLDFDRDRRAGLRLIGLPFSSSIARILPNIWPASSMSP